MFFVAIFLLTFLLAAALSRAIFGLDFLSCAVCEKQALQKKWTNLEKNRTEFGKLSTCHLNEVELKKTM